MYPIQNQLDFNLLRFITQPGESANSYNAIVTRAQSFLEDVCTDDIIEGT